MLRATGFLVNMEGVVFRDLCATYPDVIADGFPGIFFAKALGMSWDTSEKRILDTRLLCERKEATHRPEWCHTWSCLQWSGSGWVSSSAPHLCAWLVRPPPAPPPGVVAGAGPVLVRQVVVPLPVCVPMLSLRLKGKSGDGGLGDIQVLNIDLATHGWKVIQQPGK